jgi:hypothetical protein
VGHAREAAYLDHLFHGAVPIQSSSSYDSMSIINTHLSVLLTISRIYTRFWL